MPGRSAAGPALTLRCMPKREDLYGDAEYGNPELQLHRHVMYPTQEGDMIVVDAARRHGLRHLRRDDADLLQGARRRRRRHRRLHPRFRLSPRSSDLGIWVSGVTPSYHAQTAIIPFAVNVPVACGGVLVIPGEHHRRRGGRRRRRADALASPGRPRRRARILEGEEFAHIRLSEGGDLRKYYPLMSEAEAEYRALAQGARLSLRRQDTRKGPGRQRPGLFLFIAAPFRRIASASRSRRAAGSPASAA